MLGLLPQSFGFHQRQPSQFIHLRVFTNLFRHLASDWKWRAQKQRTTLLIVTRRTASPRIILTFAVGWALQQQLSPPPPHPPTLSDSPPPCVHIGITCFQNTTAPFSPWYNCRGWLCVKTQLLSVRSFSHRLQFTGRACTRGHCCNRFVGSVSWGLDTRTCQASKLENNPCRLFGTPE